MTKPSKPKKRRVRTAKRWAPVENGFPMLTFISDTRGGARYRIKRQTGLRMTFAEWRKLGVVFRRVTITWEE